MDHPVHLTLEITALRALRSALCNREMQEVERAQGNSLSKSGGQGRFLEKMMGELNL